MTIFQLRIYLERIGHIATWLCVATIIVLSLVPGRLRPHTPLGGHWEHFLAYASTGFIATGSYRHAIRTIVGLCLLSFSLELLQNLVAGRGPARADALYSTLGAAIGAGAASLVVLIVTKWFGTGVGNAGKETQFNR